MILEVDALCYRWPRRTVGPITWSLGPGTWQVTGPNGAGKTTVLRALCGALRPSAGSVRVLGRDVHRDARARRDVAWVPTRPELPGHLGVDEAWALLGAVRGRPRWDGRAYRQALGLPGDMRLDALSAGQRRRAELLAGLAGDPAVVLLDEPFADLDPTGVAWLAEWIAAHVDDRVVLFTHHGASPIAPTGTLPV